MTTKPKATAAAASVHVPATALAPVVNALTSLETHVKDADGETVEPKIDRSALPDLVEKLVEQIYGGKVVYLPVTLREMPPDFAPLITREHVRGGVVWVWRDTVMVDGLPVKLEYGMRHDDQETMRRQIWALLEHGRLGNHQHLSHARADRHQGRARTMTGQPPASAPVTP